jgi:YVTN family beta-propeller protein
VTLNTLSFRSVLRCFVLVVALLTIAAKAQQPTLSPLATINVGASPGPIAVNSAAGLAYVLNTDAGSVSAISTKTLTVSKVIPVGAAPVTLATDLGLGMVYVANSGDGTVSAIKGTAAALTWQVGGTPGPMVADTILGHLYVADTTGNQVVVLNSKTGAVQARLATRVTPAAMALNPATHAVFVANTGASGSVVVIDGVHDQIATTIGSLPVGATSISVAPQTNVALVTFQASNALSLIDAANNYAVTTTMPVGGPGTQLGCPFEFPAPYLTAYDSARQIFYISLGGSLYIGDDLGDFFLDDFWGFNAGCPNVPPSGFPAGPFNEIALDPGAGLMSSNGGPILNILFNPRFEAAYTPLPASINPTGVAFDPVKSWAYLSDAGNNTVRVYNVTPHNVVAAYEGAFGDSVTSNYADTNPATGTVYILRLNNLYAINESQAAAGYNGMANNASGVTTIPLAGSYSSALVVNAASNKIYVADGSSLFYSVNGANNVATLLPGMPANLDVTSLAVNSAANQILVFDYFSGNLFVLDGTSETVVKTIPIGLFPRGTPLLVDPVKGVAYVVGSSVFVVDLATATVTATIPLSATASSAAFNPVNSRLYAVTADSKVYVVNTSTNTLVTSFSSPCNPMHGVAANPVTGKYYLIGIEDSPAPIPHVVVYNGTTNKVVVDISGQTFPALTGADSIAVDALNNTIYVGTERGTISAALAAIDGNTNVLSAVPPSTEELNGYALAVDLGAHVLAAGGVDYTNLFFPTADLTSTSAVPVSVTMQGVSDASTIATAPLFRTRNTQPKVMISATGNYTGLAATITPTKAFFQLDGWQGTWTAKSLKRVGSTTTGTVTVTLPKLAEGRHILYVYANTGEAATIQNGASGPSSLVVSPTAAFVFTVEQ